MMWGMGLVNRYYAENQGHPNLLSAAPSPQVSSTGIYLVKQFQPQKYINSL